MDSDDALYEQLLKGKLSAFDQLYARYERPLFGFLRLQLGDRHEAEDVLHDTFIAILRERDSGRGVQSFRAWLYQVARHLCLNRVRSRKRAGRAVEQAARDQRSDSDHAHAEKQLVACEQAEELRAAVQRLPQPLAEIYQLRASGLSYEELSEVLAIPVGTVKSRMHEMLKCLRQEMQ